MKKRTLIGTAIIGLASLYPLVTGYNGLIKAQEEYSVYPSQEEMWQGAQVIRKERWSELVNKAGPMCTVGLIGFVSAGMILGSKVTSKEEEAYI